MECRGMCFFPPLRPPWVEHTGGRSGDPSRLPDYACVNQLHNTDPSTFDGSCSTKSSQAGRPSSEDQWLPSVQRRSHSRGAPPAPGGRGAGGGASAVQPCSAGAVAAAPGGGPVARGGGREGGGAAGPGGAPVSLRWAKPQLVTWFF